MNGVCSAPSRTDTYTGKTDIFFGATINLRSKGWDQENYKATDITFLTKIYLVFLTEDYAGFEFIYTILKKCIPIALPAFFFYCFYREIEFWSFFLCYFCSIGNFLKISHSINFLEP